MADLYVPLDVNVPDDPKIIAAGDMGELIFYRSLCLAKRLQSDGFISTAQARRLGATPKVVAKLVVDLWQEVEGGYRIASFLKRNPSRETVEKDRRAAADRKAAWREGQKGDATDVSHGTDDPCPTGPSLSDSELDLEGESDLEVKDPPSPKRRKPASTNEPARQVVQDLWERCGDRKPVLAGGNPFMAAVKIAEKFLAEGIVPETLTQAMLTAHLNATISIAAVNMQLTAGKRANNGRDKTADADRILAEFVEGHQ